MSVYFGDKEPLELKRRLVIAAAAVGIAFFALAVRLWYLQVKEYERYMELAANNSVRLIKSTAPRGAIYTSDGIKIADNRPGYELYLVPEDVKDWAKTKDMLHRLVDIAPEDVDAKIDDADGRPAFHAIKLKDELTWEETVKVENYKFEMPGVILEVAPKRSYLFGEAFAHLVGYLGEINERELKEVKPAAHYGLGDYVGKYGLEKALESEMRGVDGGKEIEVDALGRKIRVVNQIVPQPGGGVRLTVDLKAQLAAWDALRGKVGAAVAIEPSTGRVLAMVSSPGFDPNHLTTGISREDWTELVENPQNILNNRAIQGLYPPASTFKPIHAAAALEAGVITPSTEIYSGAAFRYGNREYRDWKEGGHGVIPVHRAIVESSDTFFYQVGLKLGVERLARCAKGFGFGTRTGIGLANEKAGLVPNEEWKQKTYGKKWFEGETISVSVGQGYMLVTPLQLAAAYAAIANGGTLYEPRLIDAIDRGDGAPSRASAPLVMGRVPISAANLAEVKEGLIGVVHEDGGTAHFLAASGLNIAGKTGTAQVARLIQRTKNVLSIPYKYRDHAWFAGFAPYDDPRIAVAVIVEHGGFGASAAAPVAREIIKAYLGSQEPIPSGGVPPGVVGPVQPRVVPASATAQDAAEASD
ncbi:MAG: penicillin-binding protein 2 [Deltaproteobacteria bacterium]|nr:penicillin-binding protein 2 [Deltaproteobacteria bacterium]